MKTKFHFSRAESIGALVLGLIIVVLLLYLNRPDRILLPDTIVLDTTSLTYIYPDKAGISLARVDQEPKTFKFNYQPFDPNTYQISDWKKIGFSEKQSEVILRYKKRINGFKTAQDLANCYVISQKKYNELEPFLRLNSRPNTRIESKTENNPQIELNTADQSALESVNGIGSFYAERIIELRQELGGYYTVEQLREIYNMTDENYNRIENQVMANKDLIQKIELHTATFNELKKHPYLNWKQCQTLIGLPNKTIDEAFWIKLSEYEVFTDLDIEKIKPYFK